MPERENKQSAVNDSEHVRLKHYAWLLRIVCTVIVLSSLVWNVVQERQEIEAIAEGQALAYFNKDQAFRIWGTMHGGVYVPVSEKTPASPYLSHIPDRDINKPSGVSLTLMNPAYMVRQMNEEFSGLYGVSGHITSLKPLRPENAADEWERRALELFEQGRPEVQEFVDVDHEPYLRLMRPMTVEKGCLKCHGHQGYQEGDIRGGVAVMLPMTDLWALWQRNAKTLAAWHVILWLLILGCIHVGAKKISLGIRLRRRAEEEMRHLQNYLKNIINSMPSMLIGVDVEGKVTEWNAETEKNTGIPADQARGRTLTDVLPRFAQEVQSITEAIQKRQIQKDEKVAQKSRGQTVYSDVTVYPLVANGVEGAVVRIDDVTDRVRLEDMMVQAEKMATVGGLAAGMAHEINNPLGVVLQGTETIERRILADLPGNQEAAKNHHLDLESLRAYLDDRQVLKMIDRIKEAGTRANGIVKNMLQFSRSSDTQKRLVRLPELIDHTIELAASDYDLRRKYDFRDVHLECDYDSKLPEILCAPTEIEQVILNLLKNAAQAMSEAKGLDKPRITIRTRGKEELVRIEVEDNGPGMSEEVRKHIFEPFFTTKEVGVGTGLGLSVSYMIITVKHQGTLTVDSSPGKGARFTVKLPIEGVS